MKNMSRRSNVYPSSSECSCTRVVLIPLEQVDYTIHLTKRTQRRHTDQGRKKTQTKIYEQQASRIDNLRENVFQSRK